MYISTHLQSAIDSLRDTELHATVMDIVSNAADAPTAIDLLNDVEETEEQHASGDFDVIERVFELLDA